MNDIERIDKICRHISNVQENCLVLGKKLIEAGEADLGRKLIANGFIHDNSKFYATEWENLDHYTGVKEQGDRTKLDLAIAQHNLSNPHHPEYWNGIKNMPRLFVAEMVADWAARASEFGTSLHDWINGGAMKRFAFSKRDKIYREIMHFVNLLVDKPFKQS
jgi:hypothetical protein